ncbi:hypothetical protein SLE2022_120990 [Rubroshorea leprosula]
MGSVNNTVHYCSVSKDNRILYRYSGGVHEIENLAALCLERIPPFHKWYLERIGKRTFGFLMNDGYVYFTIVDEDVENSCVRQFLENLKDEFENVAKMDSRGGSSGLASRSLQEQLVPAIHRLITSLQLGSHSGNDQKSPNSSFHHSGLSSLPSNANTQSEAASSTESHSLDGYSRPEKKKKKKRLNDQQIGVRDTEVGERWNSTGREVQFDSTLLASDNQNGSASSISQQREMVSMRIRSEYQDIQKKWRRQVRIVLAIYAAVCLILFLTWVLVCGGIRCHK